MVIVFSDKVLSRVRDLTDVAAENVRCASDEVLIQKMARGVAGLEEGALIACFGVRVSVSVVIVDFVTVVEVLAIAIEAQDKPSRERFVQSLLVASTSEFLVICARNVVAARFCQDPSSFWDVHVIEAVVLDRFVVEPGAAARLPFQAADHAEFGGAPACHVIAAFFELDHGGTVEAALPAFLLGDFDEALCVFIFGTVFSGMPFAVALAADFELAAAASAVFPAVVWVGVYV